MKVLQEIAVPQESVNDEYLTVVGMNFSNGDAVKKGDIILELESSKAIKTLEASADGFIVYHCAQDDEVAINEIIAHVQDERPRATLTSTIVSNKKTNGNKVLAKDGQTFDTQFSVKALRLLEQNNLAKELFSTYDFVNEQLVLKYLNSSIPGGGNPSNEKRIASNKLPDNVTVSKTTANKKREIEHLSAVQGNALVSTIYVDVNTNGLLETISDQMTLFKDSLLPLVVYECSRLLLKYPALNAFYTGIGTAAYHDVHIGIAMDIDEGLKVVKIPSASALSISEIEKSIFDLSNKYLDKTLAAADLTGITFTITDLSTDALLFTPLINKGNSAILGLSKIDNVLNRTILSLAFDHRVTEGKTAAGFLSELKARVESYALTSKVKKQELTCYKCLKNISEDMNDVGFIKVVNNRGEEKLICDMCLFNF